MTNPPSKPDDSSQCDREFKFYAAEPIRDIEQIRKIKTILKSNPRNLALFLIGISTNLRGGDIMKITLQNATDAVNKDRFTIQEKKTRKRRVVYMNVESKLAVARLLAIRLEQTDDLTERLFIGQRGPLTRATFNKLVQKWCRAVGVPGKISGHTLRKTYGYHQFHRNNVSLAALMDDFNHSSEKMTLRYIGVSDLPEKMERFQNLTW